MDDLEQMIQGLDENHQALFTKNEEGTYEFDDSSVTPSMLSQFPSDLLSFLEKGTSGGEETEQGNETYEDESGEEEDPTDESSGEVVAWEGIDSFELSKKEFDSLSEETRNKLDGLMGTLKDKAVFIGEEFQQAYASFMEDPFVLARIEQKNGNFNPDVLEKAKDIMSNTSFKSLVADMDEGKVQKLGQLIKEQIAGAMQVATLGAEESYNTKGKLMSEINSIMQLDKELQSEKSFDDPEHPLSDFFKWYIENQANINLLALGGPSTYSLYLQKTGRMDSALKTAERRGASNATRIIRGASDRATTLSSGKGDSSKTPDTNKYGVDEVRFASDRAYQKRVYEKFESDPKMRKLMEEWASQ